MKLNMLLSAVMILGFMFSCYGADNDVTEDDSKKFEVMEFSGHNWLVLEVKDDKALLLSEQVIETRRYHNTLTDITWSECAIRKYLNTEFLESFSIEDRNRILDTKVVTNNNPWYGTNGGNATTDKIFLLSLEEVVQYFGDSGQLKNRPKTDAWLIIDQYGKSRIAYDKDGTASWWCLRSPGLTTYYVAYVNFDGDVYVDGNSVRNHRLGVRPALWLNLES